MDFLIHRLVVPPLRIIIIPGRRFSDCRKK